MEREMLDEMRYQTERIELQLTGTQATLQAAKHEIAEAARRTVHKATATITANEIEIADAKDAIRDIRHDLEQLLKQTEQNSLETATKTA